jgi:hypothetical protein
MAVEFATKVAKFGTGTPSLKLINAVNASSSALIPLLQRLKCKIHQKKWRKLWRQKKFP